jgi:hypothetical protein
VSLILAVAGFAACSKQAPLLPGANQRPTIEITQAPLDPSEPFFYGYELRWAGYDVDGRIAYFRYTIDPPTKIGADTVWFKTIENRQSFLFHANTLENGADKTAEGFHTIVLEAVDDRDAVSAPVSRSLTSFTIAPTVQIISPPLDHLFPPQLGPSIHAGWTGFDPDGRGTSRPVQYKFKLFSTDGRDFPFQQILAEPDSLRRRYAPHFSEWDSVGGDTTQMDFRNLPPGQDYIVAVVAFDEAGAYSPVMSFDSNLLFCHVLVAGTSGPKMSVFSESFSFTFTSGGGFPLNPDAFLHGEFAAGRPVRIGWSAKTEGGSFVRGFRWMLDGRLDDERPREDEVADVTRWSRYSPQTTGAELGPFNPSVSESHTLYIEAQDNNTLVSIAVVQFTVVRATFDKELLIVDDTRLPGDRRLAGGCVTPPSGVWPMAAELDTFFFARGGKPWKCYPAGTLSPIGIFQGYDYDTLGTRFLPQGTLTLQQLSRYRHIVWYTDYNASKNFNNPDFTGDPMSELRWVTFTGRSNPLVTWVSQGGQLWMFGGGTASALQKNFEKSSSPPEIYSHAEGELVAGRFMYDVFGWRSEITARSVAQAQKPPHAISRSPDSLDYALLPDYLFQKTQDTDPLSVYAPYQRSISDFYRGSHIGEGLTKPNEIVEDRGPGPNGPQLESVLDTLYESVGGQLGSDKPVMTIWHGGTTGQRQVFSGFALWYWGRTYGIAISDFVLQKVWGLPRRDVPR